MEEFPRAELTQGRVYFKTQQELSTYKNGKFEFEQRCWTRANKEIRRRNKECSPSCYESLDIPMHTMEFLCRSWSPTASNFLHKFSSSNNKGVDVKHGLEIHEDKKKVNYDSDLGEEDQIVQVQVNDAKSHAAQTNYRNSASLGNKKWTRFLVDKSIPYVTQSSISFDFINRSIKEWLRQRSFTGVFKKWQRGEKKKEEDRVLTAKTHASLSVAQLAAAIAGFAATNSLEIFNDIHNEDMEMSNVVAYAAALIASACAEAAESVGATKAHVASAVNSGLATQSSADMITHIASAATSLRGVETLKSRAMSGLHFSSNKEPVKLAAKLLISTPSGQKVLRLVSIHLEHRQMMLRLEKKYLGVITTSKEYTILQVMREKKAQGYYILGIKCDGRYIKLLFEDKKQSLVWTSNISNFLQTYNSCHI